jgi:hypothetical protein
MYKNIVIFCFVILVVLSGCGEKATPYPTLEPLPTYTFQPTFTVPPTQTPWVILITPTPSPTPLFTPTNTVPPTATLPPTATKDITRADKQDGVYLVGEEIAVGLWRSEKDVSDDCYWETTTKKGDINNNYFGLSGGTMYLRKSDFQVSMEDCGTWKYMGE